MKAPILIATALALAPLAAPAQQPIEMRGTIVHQAAGTGFPERIGQFRRSNAARFDVEGRNLGASYNAALPGGRLLISVYIYPAGRVAASPGSGEAADVARDTLCRREFEEVEQTIERTQPDARVIERGGAAAVPGAEPRLGYRTVYQLRTRFDGEVQPVRSEARLYCHVGGGWQVKYRASSPVAVDAAGAIEAFVRQGPWPGRAPPPSADETVALSGPRTAAR